MQYELSRKRLDDILRLEGQRNDANDRYRRANARYYVATKSYDHTVKEMTSHASLLIKLRFHKQSTPGEWRVEDG